MIAVQNSSCYGMFEYFPLHLTNGAELTYYKSIPEFDPGKSYPPISFMYAFSIMLGQSSFLLVENVHINVPVLDTGR